MENKQREEESAFLLVEDLEEQERVVEAVLFTMGQSVEVGRLAAAMGQDEDCARKAALRLKSDMMKSEKGCRFLNWKIPFRCAPGQNIIRI